MNTFRKKNLKKPKITTTGTAKGKKFTNILHLRKKRAKQVLQRDDYIHPESTTIAGF